MNIHRKIHAEKSESLIDCLDDDRLLNKAV